MASRNRRQSNKLLDRLQEESWQLELIISGVIIFLLLGLYEPLERANGWTLKLTLGDNPFFVVGNTLLGFLRFSHVLLIAMFLLHLGVRGLWIGAIGLRSVSGGFELYRLGYQDRFREFLIKRLGRFDNYIDRLERNASITFSLAFLLFSAVLSVGTFFVVLFVIVMVFTGADGYLGYDATQSENFERVILVVMAVVILTFTLTGLLYFIDFFTFGWFKKRPWFGKIYYPLYRFFSWVTLARLYRPLYYNIADNRFGRRLMRVYLLVAFLVMMVSAFSVTPFPNFYYAARSPEVVHAGQYLDEDRFEDPASMNFIYPSLGSLRAKEDYLEVFLPSSRRQERRVIAHRYPDLLPLQSSSFQFGTAIKVQTDTNAAATLAALSSIYRLYLDDSLLTDVSWRFHDHPVREQPGLIYYLPVYDLERGEHFLRVENQRVKDDSLYWREVSDMLFLR